MDGYNRGKPLTGLLGRTVSGSTGYGQPNTYQPNPTVNMEHRQTITPQYGNRENRQGFLPGAAPRTGSGIMRPVGHMEQFPTIRPGNSMTPQRPGSWIDHFYTLLRRNGFGG